MDTETLVDQRIDGGERFLSLLAQEGIAVRAACWIKRIDEDRWTLFIASPILDQKGILPAYGDIVGVIRKLNDAWVTASNVTLVSDSDPLVRDTQELLTSYPNPEPMEAPRARIGRVPAERVFVYPLEKVEVTVYGLIYRGEPGSALHLSLEPHPPRSSVEIETQGQRRVYPAETGYDSVISAPRGATLHRNNIGQLVLTWELHGREIESSANEVYSLARLTLHGFRLLRESK